MDYKSHVTNNKTYYIYYINLKILHTDDSNNLDSKLTDPYF